MAKQKAPAKAAPAGKSAAKSAPKAAKASKQPEAKADKKGAKAAKGKGAAEDEVAAEESGLEDRINAAEEAEEQEEAASSGGGGADAALAAASSSEMSASFKNFRHHPDMENFYRFIYENDLRMEALTIIDEIMVQKALRKAAGKTTATKGKH